MDASSSELAAWAEVAEELEWAAPWTTVYAPDARVGGWFAGGRINLAVNCVDRHVRAGRSEAPAILWEGEPGDRRVLTYGRLRTEVGSLAGALRGLGVGTGDLVALHLSALPETATAMLACARIGAVHTMLAANQPAAELSTRLAELRPKVLFTQDGSWNGGMVIPMKARLDDAVAASGYVPDTVVVQRTGTPVGWRGNDHWLHDLVGATRSSDHETGPLPAALGADHVACVSVLTGRKGRTAFVRHRVAGLLTCAVAVHRYGLAAAGGVLWCTTDVSSVESVVHGVYGPLACGDTTVMYEGMLDMPTRSRAWELIRRHGVRTLVARPSAIRRLRGPSRRPRPATTPLRRVVIVGTPEDEDIAWLRGVSDDASETSEASSASTASTASNDAADDARVSVDVAWAATQTTGIALVSDPVDPARFPDAGFAIADDDVPGDVHDDVPGGGPGELVMSRPWAGLAPTVDASGAVAARDLPDGGVYRTGELVRRRPDGRFVFLGPRAASPAEVTSYPTRDASPGTA